MNQEPNNKNNNQAPNGEQQNKEPMSAVDFAAKLADQKKNMVDKSLYEKAQKDIQDLTQALLDGKTIEPAAPEAPKETLEEARIRLGTIMNSKPNNLKYCEAALELRNKVLEETGVDCFVADNSHCRPTQESYAAAENLANVMKECIEYANGDSQVFTQELMRRTNDVQLPFNRK